jgi:hypothetical protein
MSDDTPSPLNNVITIDDERIKSHLERVVRGTVEECSTPRRIATLSTGRSRRGATVRSRASTRIFISTARVPQASQGTRI